MQRIVIDLENVEGKEQDAEARALSFDEALKPVGRGGARHQNGVCSWRGREGVAVKGPRGILWIMEISALCDESYRSVDIGQNSLNSTPKTYALYCM